MTIEPNDALRGAFPSLWSATEIPAPATPALTESRQVDVLIIGAGYTGLSTALHLAEQGVRACVLDAQEPGWGASGRNGGQVIPGLKDDPQTIRARHGNAQGDRIIEMIGSTADTVFELIERYGIDCDAVRKGWIQPAHTPKIMPALVSRAKQWEAEGAHVDVLDREQVASRLGTRYYVGGWIDYRAGSLQPLSYVRGLAAAAQGLGVAIHGDSRVVDLKLDGEVWRATLHNGVQITADRVVLGTNGYTDGLWPGLQQTVLAANSFIVATRPLSPAEGDPLPGGVVASDSRRLLLYYRRDAQGRLVVGGRGHFSEPTSPGDWDHLARSIVNIFPSVAGVPLEYRWAGRIALTRDHLPHVHEPAPGLTIALGYNGRGVAMATQFGKYLARHLLGKGGLPLPASELKPFPLHRLRRFYIGLGVMYYGLMDRLS